MMIAKRLLAVGLALALAIPAVADIKVVSRNQDSGNAVTSDVTPGVTTVTGCTNQVVYGDAADLVGCEGAFGYNATTNTLTVDTITAVSTGGLTVTGANGGKWVSGVASEALTLDTGAAFTDTVANLLPANSIIDAVTYRITTTITTSVSFTVGISGTADRFCTAQSVMTAGTTGVCLNATTAANTGPLVAQTSAAKVRITLNAAPGAGVVRLQVHYRTFTPPTS